MKTTIIDGKEIPVVKAAKVTTIIKNKKTGEVYKTEEELSIGSGNLPLLQY